MPSSKNSYPLSRSFSVSVCLPPFLLIDYANIEQKFQYAKYDDVFHFLQYKVCREFQVS